MTRKLLPERRDDAIAERCGADEAEHADHHEQQGIDGGKAIPSEAHDKDIGLIVAELLDHGVSGSGKTIALLPTVDGSHQPLEDTHGRASPSRLARHTWTAILTALNPLVSL